MRTERKSKNVCSLIFLSPQSSSLITFPDSSQEGSELTGLGKEPEDPAGV
jgi:hypothetical protein